ncbi:hypothetical protein GCM10010869_47940 [Mesorhizobium tianshanense]|uniref:Uncharacterized protein n=1 Tax=Mesorhizobium tianshanense TaxID=39844 RepID=A0A562NSW0_9HYPH|nr:hypothetical protein [Mesorhizobium tianshanense]TWI35292.1 hypothetical protein IQ26_03272 [Mesorhizobium tianshanense]GLS39197.1 hypothetical protein GCM10010869_47940 [Mesorhizobium tianshanense]
MATLTEKTLTSLASEFRLSPGKHSSPDEGMCAMELVAFLDGGPHTDQPRCTCELVSAFVRSINDNMPDDVRHKLLPFLPRLIGTVADNHEQEQERHDYFAWQTIRVFAPAALRAQGYRRFARVLQNAETLRSARAIADTVRRGVANKETDDTPTPAALAVHHAARAAGAAMWFAGRQDGFLKGNSITPWTTCPEAAASAAFQAHRAGSAGVWDQALDALEGVLSIGSAERGSATIARSAVGALSL